VPAAGGSAFVDHTSMGNGENPRPKTGDIARERAEVAGHLEEHLTEEILGFGRTPDT